MRNINTSETLQVSFIVKCYKLDCCLL